MFSGKQASEIFKERVDDNAPAEKKRLKSDTTIEPQFIQIKQEIKKMKS